MIRPLLLILLLVQGACVGGAGKPAPAALDAAQKRLGSGVEHYQSQHYRDAYQQFVQALNQYRLLDHPQGIVASSINIARVLHAVGNDDAARRWLRKARELNRQYQPPGRAQLAQHITLLEIATAMAHKQDNNDDATAQRLENLISDSRDEDIRLAALQLRTRLAQQTGGDFIGWLQRYTKAVENREGAHRARLLRFQAQAGDNGQRQDALFARALAIYRESANKTGIAASLHEWAQLLYERQRFEQAENLLRRALRIRLAMGDRKHSMASLKTLHAVQQAAGRTQQAQTSAYWLAALSAEDFKQWQAAMQALDDYPTAPAEAVTDTEALAQ